MPAAYNFSHLPSSTWDYVTISVANALHDDGMNAHFHFIGFLAFSPLSLARHSYRILTNDPSLAWDKRDLFPFYSYFAFVYHGKCVANENFAASCKRSPTSINAVYSLPIENIFAFGPIDCTSEISLSHEVKSFPSSN